MEIKKESLEKVVDLYQDALDALQKEGNYCHKIYLDGLLDTLYLLGLEDKVKEWKK